MERPATSQPRDLAHELVRVVEDAWPGVVLRDYRAPVLRRRVESRMAILSIASADEYLRRVAADATELDALTRHLRIQTSAFFRNRDVFARLRVIVEEMAPTRSGEPRRAWSAGCARGEEAYSLATLAASDWCVLGTDVDEVALAAARAAVYPRRVADDLDADEELRLFGDRVDRGSTGPLTLRPPASEVTFAEHDLLRTSDPPPGAPFDIVLCRNVLIYFVGPAQRRIQDLLARALRPGGFLCLGEAEALAPNVTQQFRVVDKKARLFQKR